MSATLVTYIYVLFCSRHALLLCFFLHLLTVFEPAAFSQVTWAIWITDGGQVDLPSAYVTLGTLRHTNKRYTLFYLFVF